MRLPRPLLLSSALALCAAGCGGGDGATAPAKFDSKAAGGSLEQTDPNLLAAQVASTLQACSYDGSPVKFGLGGDAPADCRDMIAQVMNFTGLPQNFVVTEAPVPNAAAAILLDDEKMPHRVIGFNPEFIDLVRKATGGNVWGAVSVMAHEAGHHLAGHTIQPGGSQPPIELEADKFSGFVLYKMGASRDDALKAIPSLVPEEVPHGATHPPRARRVGAITEGWDQACAQTGRGDCASGAPGAAPPAGIVSRVAQSPAPRPDNGLPGSPQAPAPTPAQAPVDGGFDRGGQTPSAGATTTMPTVVVMPKADPGALPTKGTQFVYDELGMLDPGVVAKVEQQLYEHARLHGVEIVVILAKDLDGMEPDAYAWSMLRQLRVGKLDVGNGAVLVYAPGTRQFGMALGPGIRNEMAFHLDGYAASAKRFFDFNWDWCQKQGRCPAGNTETLFLTADQIRRDTAKWEWTMRFQSLGDIMAAEKAERDAREQSGEDWKPTAARSTSRPTMACTRCCTSTRRPSA